MDASVLFDDTPAVDGHRLTVGESALDDSHGLGIVFRLMVGGHQNRSVQNQEIGVGGGQLFSVFVIDRRGEWQFQQTVGLSVKCPQVQQLL